jgi:chromosome segregation ATPase
VEKFTKDMGHKLMDVASALSGLGSSAANLLRERALDPLQERIQQLKDDLGGLDDQLEEMERFSKLGWLDESELERLAELQAERAEKAAELASSEERVAEIEERLTLLREQQANLSFLEAQMRLLDTIQENGLNAGEILKGITLGLDADLEDLIDAMVRAMQAMIESAEDELGISSPSKVFRGIAQNIKDTVAQELGNTRQLEQAAANLAGSVSEAFDFRFDQAVGAFEPFQMDVAAAGPKVLPAPAAPPASAFQAAGGAGKTVNYITVQAELKRDLDRYELARDVAREIERRSR